MPFQSTNPASGEVFAEYAEHSSEEIDRRLALAETAFEDWRDTSFAQRATLMRQLAIVIRGKALPLAQIAAQEMGRPVTAGQTELEKCAQACEFFADNAEKMLADEPAQADGSECYVRHDPLGPVLAVMPWNFPYWQVLRFASQALMAGNVGLLKHSSNVQGCAAAIEDLFREAGFPNGCFQNLAIRASGVEAVLRDPRVKAASVTGGEKAGAAVAAICGSEIKKTVLELGGNDAFIVLADADLESCADAAVTARLQNSGQSCIAAKRFIVADEVHDKFVDMIKERVATKVVIGDPLDPATTFGPLANEEGLHEIAAQVEQSIASGAVLVLGGKRADRAGWFYEPTILIDVMPFMRVAAEETFGPVFSIIRVSGDEAAIEEANDSEFGLGASIWTRDISKAKAMARRINTGFVAINNMVRSHQALAFGGVGKSGYGRELGPWGIKEFVNVKSVRVA